MPQLAARKNRPIPVAQYLRMSTEHQRYSTTNQREAIERYAAEHDMEVIKTYEDSGRSGLTLLGRPALQMLLDDVASPYRKFQAIVVYDVSRWGRFQDVDESAYYEFVCRRAGVLVHYCAESFGEVAGPMSVVIKSVKRAMAAEYSRELGKKVIAGQCQLSRRGFHMGGFANFGLRRILVSENGEVKGELGPREWKSIQTDRVVFAPGNPLEVYLVRRIFEMCAYRGMTEAEIARYLNWCGWPGRINTSPWNTQAVRGLLRQECYAGTQVFNRRSCRLKTPWVKNPRKDWVVTENCFEGLVSQATFDAARQKMESRYRHYWTDEELLDVVRKVYATKGTVRPWMMRSEVGQRPDTSLLAKRFGSLADACVAAGVPADEHLDYRRERQTRRRSMKIELLEALFEMLREKGVGFYWSANTRRALIEGGMTVSVRVMQPFFRNDAPPYWLATPDLRLGPPDAAILARLRAHSDQILDYVVFPADVERRGFINRYGLSAHSWLDAYRLRTMEKVVARLLSIRASTQPAKRLPISLAKRRRRVLSIKRRVDPYYLARPLPSFR